MWLLDDVVCDFAAIYHTRIDPDGGDFAGLTGPQFLRLASRLPVYQGAVRARLAMTARDEPAAATTGPVPAAGVQMLEATPLMLTTHPLLAQFGSYATTTADGG